MRQTVAELSAGDVEVDVSVDLVDMLVEEVMSMRKGAYRVLDVAGKDYCRQQCRERVCPCEGEGAGILGAVVDRRLL